jgi:hypothetical protein
LELEKPSQVKQKQFYSRIFKFVHLISIQKMPSPTASTTTTIAARRTAAADATVLHQTNLLPRRQLLIVFSALAISHVVCFIEQTGIGVALPTIGRDLDAEDTISWAGTSALIANTMFHVLYGRMSDLFGWSMYSFHPLLPSTSLQKLK